MLLSRLLFRLRAWQIRRVCVLQNDLSDCGPACLKSLAAWHGHKISLQKLRMESGTGRSGTTIQGMIDAARTFGFEPQAGKAGVELLRHLEQPAILLMQKGPLMHFLVFYPNFSNVLIMDPAEGKLLPIDWEELETNWSGIMIILKSGSTMDKTEELKTPFAMIWEIILENRRAMLICILYSILFTLMGLVFPVYIKIVMDQIIPKQMSGMMDQISLLMLLVLLLTLFVSWNRGITSIKMGIRIDRKLTLGYFQHLLKLPQVFFDSMRTGEIISRIGDVVRIRAFIADSLMALTINLLIVFGSFILMGYYSPKLTGFLLLLIPVYFLLFSFFNRLFSRNQKQVMECWARMESFWVSTLNCMQTIRHYGLEGKTEHEHRTQFEQLAQSNYQSSVLSLLNLQWTEFLSKLSLLFLLWMGVKMVIDQELSLGSLLSFYALIGFFNTPLQNLMSMNRLIQSAWIAAERLMDLQSTDSRTLNNTGVAASIFPVELSSVSYNYIGLTPVLENINLRFNRGEFVVLTGRSGSGKSTLLGLLNGDYSLTSGTIQFNDLPVSERPSGAVLKKIGYAPQFPQIIPKTFLENICMEKKPNPESVLRMIKNLAIEDFMESFPMGISTFLGEGGMVLSGGQKQVVSILRIMYRDPEWVILDEPHSMMDSVTSQILERALIQWQRQNKSILMITHNKKWLSRADRGLHLENAIIREVASGDLVNHGN